MQATGNNKHIVSYFHDFDCRNAGPTLPKENRRTAVMKSTVRDNRCVGGPTVLRNRYGGVTYFLTQANGYRPNVTLPDLE